LPRDIAVKAGYCVDDSFNVRRQAVSREYSYYILNSQTRSPLRRNFAHHLHQNLDIEAMAQSAQSLVGEHDFTSIASGLSSEVKSTVRRVFHAGVRREGELIVFNIVANAFLLHQVRNTVGALIRIGLGKMSYEEFLRVMEAKQVGLAGPTAPACGLCLMQINYSQPFGEGI
jgi:tRNA pseudouridine38-40 synthase